MDKSVKLFLVGVCQDELGMDFMTACEYVSDWLSEFMKSNNKIKNVTIGSRTLQVEKK